MSVRPPQASPSPQDVISPSNRPPHRKMSLNVLLTLFSIAKDTGLMTGMPLSTYPYG